MKIAKKENIKIEDNAAKLIAKKAKGSVRDSLQHLQFVSDFCGDNEVTVEMSQKALGVIDESLYFELIETVMNSDVPNAMLLINKLMVKGRNSEQIIKGLGSIKKEDSMSGYLEGRNKILDHALSAIKELEDLKEELDKCSGELPKEKQGMT